MKLISSNQKMSQELRDINQKFLKELKEKVPSQSLREDNNLVNTVIGSTKVRDREGIYLIIVILKHFFYQFSGSRSLMEDFQTMKRAWKLI